MKDLPFLVSSLPCKTTFKINETIPDAPAALVGTSISFTLHFSLTRIGLGQAHATLVNQSFLLWCFVTPLVGAAVADQYLGRVKTIAYSSMLYLFGLVILVASSLPGSHDIGISFLGLILALFLIGIGTGGIKANMSSLIAEQYVGPKEAICTLKSGESVIVDKKLTIQRYLDEEP